MNSLPVLGAVFLLGIGTATLAAVVLYGRIFDRLNQQAWDEVLAFFPGIALPTRVRALAHVGGTPRPVSLADSKTGWPVNAMDTRRDIAWRARNLVEPLACPYIGDTADITQAIPPVNLAGEQTAEQFGEQPNAALLPAARLAGRLAAAVRRWVQGRRQWRHAITARWQATGSPGQHRKDEQRAVVGGLR